MSIAVTSHPAAACSVCLAGDPVFSVQGTTAQEQGSFSAFLDVRGWTKRSGTLPHEGSGDEDDHEEGEHGDDEHEEDEHGDEEHEEDEHGDEEHSEERSQGQRLDLYLSWTPIDRLTVTLDVPWAFNKITEIEGSERVTSKLSGLGDVSLQTSAVLWRNRDVLPSTWFEGRGFLKFPSGKSKQKVDGVKDPHLQVGTGSWDFGFGLAGTHRPEWGAIFSSVSYRVNTEGSLDYEYGDVFLANGGIQVPLGHALGQPCLDPFTAGLELNFRWADFDEFRDEKYRHSGGPILYITPSLRVKLPLPWEGNRPSFRAAVQIPATSSWLNGFQKENPVWFVGMQYTF